MLKRLALLLILILTALVACTPVASESPTDRLPPRDDTALPNAEPVSTTAPVEAMPEVPIDTPQVQAAVNDLAARLGIPSTDIEAVRAEPVTWSDGSLGCPQPDMMYTQALVDGMFIQLRVGDDLYSYHSGGSADPFLCESAVPVAPGELPPGAFGAGC